MNSHYALRLNRSWIIGGGVLNTWGCFILLRWKIPSVFAGVGALLPSFPNVRAMALNECSLIGRSCWSILWCDNYERVWTLKKAFKKGRLMQSRVSPLNFGISKDEAWATHWPDFFRRCRGICSPSRNSYPTQMCWIRNRQDPLEISESNGRGGPVWRQKSTLSITNWYLDMMSIMQRTLNGTCLGQTFLRSPLEGIDLMGTTEKEALQSSHTPGRVLIDFRGDRETAWVWLRISWGISKAHDGANLEGFWCTIHWKPLSLTIEVWDESGHFHALKKSLDYPQMGRFMDECLLWKHKDLPQKATRRWIVRVELILTGEAFREDLQLEKGEDRPAAPGV